MSAGRRKGQAKADPSRAALSEGFVTALAADFETHGEAVIAQIRQERPHDYLKLVQGVLPKDGEAREGAFDGIGDEDLAALILAARQALGPAARSRGGTGRARRAKPAEGL